MAALARIAVPALYAACALATGLLSGCGSDAEGTPAGATGETPPPSPLARVAIAGPFEQLDPLYADSHSERVVSRQIYDPPVARLDPPLGVTGTRRGPLLPVGTQPGSPDWYFEVRPGIRFQDGSPLNAAAIVLNSLRWLASGMADRVLPELDAVDTPLPGGVRFQLNAPVPDLPARISDPRFGLIASSTLKRYRLDEIPDGEGGSGAFSVGVASPERVLLTSSPAWWGTEAQLGPGVDQLEFRSALSPVQRLALLNDGAAEIADDLGPRAATVIADQPLLSLSEQGDRILGASAAVRGLRAGPLEQPFSEIWLTELRP